MARRVDWKRLQAGFRLQMTVSPSLTIESCTAWVLRKLLTAWSCGAAASEPIALEVTDYLLELTRVCSQGSKERPGFQFEIWRVDGGKEFHFFQPVSFHRERWYLTPTLNSARVPCGMTDFQEVPLCNGAWLCWRNYHIFFQLIEARQSAELKSRFLSSLGLPEVFQRQKDQRMMGTRERHYHASVSADLEDGHIDLSPQVYHSSAVCPKWSLPRPWYHGHEGKLCTELVHVVSWCGTDALVQDYAYLRNCLPKAMCISFLNQLQNFCCSQPVLGFCSIQTRFQKNAGQAPGIDDSRFFEELKEAFQGYDAKCMGTTDMQSGKLCRFQVGHWLEASVRGLPRWSLTTYGAECVLQSDFW